MRRPLAIRILSIVVVILSLGIGTKGTVSATHPFDPPFRLVGLHPLPNGTAYYSLCTTDPATQWLWAWGPESWETATGGAMRFTLSSVACNINSQEQIQWEGYFFCGENAFACHIRYEMSWHKDPTYGNHSNVYKAKIVWDANAWAITTNSQRRAASAHEMGHGMSLEDHEADACGELTIMGYIGNQVCYEQPTFWDAIAAQGAYGYFG